MAIQPIDLQTMYSQMNNVAKVAAQQQNGAQLTQAMAENTMIQQKQEQATTVHKAADSEAKSGQVNPDGHNENENLEHQKRNQPEEQKIEEKKKEIHFRESYLGNHIDILR